MFIVRVCVYIYLSNLKSKLLPKRKKIIEKREKFGKRSVDCTFGLTVRVCTCGERERAEKPSEVKLNDTEKRVRRKLTIQKQKNLRTKTVVRFIADLLRACVCAWITKLLLQLNKKGISLKSTEEILFFAAATKFIKQTYTHNKQIHSVRSKKREREKIIRVNRARKEKTERKKKRKLRV